MLRELTVENLALLDALRLDFGPGFTVLTGETGAGKSIIIDALNAVLGERVGAEAIRSGETAAYVEAVFTAADAPRALEILESLGLREDEEGTVILSRELSGGRSHYRVNRRTATLSLVQQIGSHLVDIHGQHEHQTLIHEENHLSFLDAFGGPEHLGLRSAYEELYGAFQQAAKALEDLALDERERAQRVDMLRFQVEEIRAAGLEADEEERLGTERTRLQHAERIRETVAQACELLDGDSGDAPSAVSAVQTAGQELRGLVKFEPLLGETAEELEQAGVAIQEAVRTLSGYLDGLEADPDRLEQIENRLADIGKLKRKYGDTIADLLAFGERAEAELSELENLEVHEEQLRANLEKLRGEAGKAAQALSAARVKLAKSLKKIVEAELSGLGMAAAKFEVQIEHEEDAEGLPGSGAKRWKASRRGFDVGRFLFCANAGEELRPLSKVASGGELSRLMLVFKSVCSRGAEIPTIVFDEVDAGIGGRVAHSVGEKLVGVARAGQVLCVTHLPQIARLGDRHLRVEKHVEEGRTVARVEVLSAEGRVDELARMLGADESDETGRKHAAELLRDGEKDRRRLRAAAS